MDTLTHKVRTQMGMKSAVVTMMYLEPDSATADMRMQQLYAGLTWGCCRVACQASTSLLPPAAAAASRAAGPAT